MIRINVEVVGEWGTALVAARAGSIGQALALVEGRYAAERCTLLFPLPPEGFFAAEAGLDPGLEKVPQIGTSGAANGDH